MISSHAEVVEVDAHEAAPSVHASALDTMSLAANYHEWIFATVRPFIGQRVVEVGGGYGSFSHALQERERLITLDNDPVCCLRLRKRFSERGNIRIVEGDILDAAVAQDLAEERLDTAVCVNVLEHIENDVTALVNMHDVLQPGGHVIVFVPASPLLYGALDTELGHVRRYRRRELREKVASAGFTIEHCHYFNSIGALSWFVAGRVRRQRIIQANQVRLYDRAVVPILSRAERLIPPPFGQSLAIVARK